IRSFPCSFRQRFLLVTLGRLPLVEPVGDENATLSQEKRTKELVLLNGIASDIDLRGVHAPFLLSPGRGETPEDVRQIPFPVLLGNNSGNKLRWRRIIAGRVVAEIGRHFRTEPFEDEFD